MDYLNGDYIHGYTQAIMDIQEVFDYIELDLAHHHKKMSSKTAEQLLNVCLSNRANLREKRNGFIRWNGITNKFEWFTGKG